MKEFISFLRTGEFSKYLIGQLFLYSALFFSFNNLTFFLPVFLFWLYLFWRLKKPWSALWLVLVAVFPFNWGLRTLALKFPLPFNFLQQSKLPPYFYFPLTAKLTLSPFLLVVLAFKKSKKGAFSSADWFLAIFLFFSLLSAATSIYQNLSFLGLIEILMPVSLYFLGKYFLKEKKTFLLTMNFLSILLVFEGGLAVGQFLLGRPFGRLIEESIFISPYGRTAIENVFYFRSAGTFSDPNTLALFSLMMAVFIFAQLISKKAFFAKEFLEISFIVGLLGLITTFSRGAWLIFGLIISGIIIFTVKKRLFLFRQRRMIIILLILLIVLAPLLAGRLSGLYQSLWSRGSSGESRIMLIQESLAIIGKNPWLGIGPENFISRAAEGNRTGVISYFPYPVHSLYFLLASELGLPALFCLLFFIYLSLKNSRELDSLDLEKRGLKIGISAGIFAYLLGIFIYIGKGPNLDLLFLFLAIIGRP